MSFDLVRWLFELPGGEQTLSAGQHLFHRGDPVRQVFVVEEGGVELVRYLEDGAAVILQRALAGTILAEASLFSSQYHCDAVAVAPTRLKSIQKTLLKTRLRSHAEALECFASYLAQEVQQTRMRSEILRLKTVAQKLDAWLAWHDDKLPKKGNWWMVASDIGVSPEALYREMARRRSRA